MDAPACPTCRTTMEPGFLVDNSYGMVARSQWAEGEPSYSMWTGMRMRGRERLDVTTYRCVSCGFLASYARSEQRK